MTVTPAEFFRPPEVRASEGSHLTLHVLSSLGPACVLLPTLLSASRALTELFLLTGYGHTVPLSDGGKAFCIIYSVIGIPFTLLFLTAVVQRVTVHVTRRPVLYFHIRWGFSKQVVAIVHAVLLGFVTVSCFFFIPAAVFSVLEDDWNFLESFYFCFISLSTIGLGDYVPGEGYNQKFRELYKIGITCEYLWRAACLVSLLSPTFHFVWGLTIVPQCLLALSLEYFLSFFLFIYFIYVTTL